MRRRLSRVAVGLVVVAAMAAPAGARATLASDVGAEADWIMSARLPDGAIANYVDRQAVWPYLSNFAAMGLAKATTVTKNTSYVAAAWSWLSWYQAHENTQGFVTTTRCRAASRRRPTTWTRPTPTPAPSCWRRVRPTGPPPT